MLLQRIWGVRRLKNPRRLGMLGGTLASCALALALVPSAYALACGSQSTHKTTHTSSSHTSSSHTHKKSNIHYVYVYECSCGKKVSHPSASSSANPQSHKSDGQSSGSSDGHNSGGDHGSHGGSSGGNNGSNGGGSSNPPSGGNGGGNVPGLPFTGSDPEV